jgi:BrnA antitoxin of type II toxin-antitoxin system
MRKEYDFSKGKRGPVIPTPPGKTRITIRLDDDVLAWFRAQVHEAGGGNYQTLMNRALREFMTSRPERLEDTLRRVLREERAKYERVGSVGPGPTASARGRTGRR